VDHSVSFYRLIFGKYAPLCNVSTLKFYTYLLEISNCAYYSFPTRTYHHLPLTSPHRTWFWRSWYGDSLSTSYLRGEVKEPVICLALDISSSLLCLSGIDSLKESLLKGIPGKEVGSCLYTWPVRTAFRIKWRSYWGWLGRSKWFHPKSLKHWCDLLSWLLWYLDRIFFSFSQIPC